MSPSELWKVGTEWLEHGDFIVSSHIVAYFTATILYLTHKHAHSTLERVQAYHISTHKCYSNSSVHACVRRDRQGVCALTRNVSATRLFFIHITLRLIRKMPAQSASQAHMLCSQRAKSTLKSEWASKTNRQVHEWAPCLARFYSSVDRRTNLWLFHPLKELTPYAAT